MKKAYSTMKFMLVVVILALLPMNSYSQKARSEIADKYKWDLSGIFKSEADWRAAKEAIASKIKEVEKFKGTLTKSAVNLLSCLEFNSALNKEATKLFLYAGMNSDLDTRNMNYTGMKQELEQKPLLLSPKFYPPIGV